MPEGAFALERGDGEVTEYLWNHHVIHHTFCKTCGILSYARGTAPDGKRMVAINVRCLDDVDVDGLTITKFDGKSR